MIQDRRRFRRVCVLTPDNTKPEARYSDTDLRYHAAMRDALLGLAGYEFDFLNDHSRLLPRLLDDPPEFVLNFCDTGFRNIAAQELHIPALLEVLNVPYSGAPPACMALCYDKAVVRRSHRSRAGRRAPRRNRDRRNSDGWVRHARA